MAGRGEEVREISIYTPILKTNPKAKPLAQTLIAAAAEQGASLEELQIACELAVRAYQTAQDKSAMLLSVLKREAETALDGI